MAIGVKCQFECSLGKDPEMKYSNNGDPFTTVSAAVTVNNKKDDTSTLWVNLEFWGSAAEVANSQLFKGDRLSVTEAMLSQREYTDKEGIQRVYTKFNVYQFTKIAKLDWSNSGNGGNQEQAKSTTNQRQSSSGNNKGSAKPATASRKAAASYDDDDDIPF